MSQARILKVLSVQQPFADDIIFGDKNIEYRSWKTDYRGPIWIHASRWESRPDPEDLTDPEFPPGPKTLGAIIGVVELVTCFESSDLSLVLEARSEVSWDLESIRRDYKLFYEELQEDPEDLAWYQAEIARLEAAEATRNRTIPPRLQTLADWIAGLRPDEKAFPSGDGCFWLLRTPRALATPIPIKGRLRLWKTEVDRDRLQLVDPKTLLVTR